LKRDKLINISVAGLFAAIICLATSLIKIPSPATSGGYIHPGDAFILCAVYLTGIYGIPAAIIGSAIADILAGYMIYAPATIIIKGIMALAVYLILKKSKKKKIAFVFSAVISEIIMLCGYFIYEAFVFNPGAALAGISFNLIQAVGSIIIAAALLPIIVYVKKSITNYYL